MRHFLDFEKPVAELEGRSTSCGGCPEPDGINIAEEYRALTDNGGYSSGDLRQAHTLAEDLGGASSGPAQGAIIRRADHRLHTACGRWAFAEDAAVVGGLGRLHGRSVMVLGTEKGADTDSRLSTISAWRGLRATARPGG